jgi:hypothetical protein
VNQCIIKNNEFKKNRWKVEYEKNMKKYENFDNYELFQDDQKLKIEYNKLFDNFYEKLINFDSIDFDFDEFNFIFENNYNNFNKLEPDNEMNKKNINENKIKEITKEENEEIKKLFFKEIKKSLLNHEYNYYNYIFTFEKYKKMKILKNLVYHFIHKNKINDFDIFEKVNTKLGSNRNLEGCFFHNVESNFSKFFNSDVFLDIENHFKKIILKNNKNIELVNEINNNNIELKEINENNNNIELKEINNIERIEFSENEMNEKLKIFENLYTKIFKNNEKFSENFFNFSNFIKLEELSNYNPHSDDSNNFEEIISNKLTGTKNYKNNFDIQDYLKNEILLTKYMKFKIISKYMNFTNSLLDLYATLASSVCSILLINQSYKSYLFNDCISTLDKNSPNKKFDEINLKNSCFIDIVPLHNFITKNFVDNSYNINHNDPFEVSFVASINVLFEKIKKCKSISFGLLLFLNYFNFHLDFSVVSNFHSFLINLSFIFLEIIKYLPK